MIIQRSKYTENKTKKLVHAEVKIENHKREALAQIKSESIKRAPPSPKPIMASTIVATQVKPNPPARLNANSSNNLQSNSRAGNHQVSPPIPPQNPAVINSVIDRDKPDPPPNWHGHPDRKEWLS